MDGMALDGNPHCDALVLFGITGDLAKKKLFPAVYHMVREGTLPEDVPIVGVASSPWSDDDLRKRAREAIIGALGDAAIDEDAFKSLVSRLSYVSGDYSDSATYESLALAVQGHEHPLFYLAIPPSLFDDV